MPSPSDCASGLLRSYARSMKRSRADQKAVTSSPLLTNLKCRGGIMSIDILYTRVEGRVKKWTHAFILGGMLSWGAWTLLLVC